MNYKRHSETIDPIKGHEYHFTSQCIMSGCETTMTITVKGPDLFRYHNRGRGEHVQDIFSYLTPSEREMLFMSGICDNHDVWKEEDDEA